MYSKSREPEPSLSIIGSDLWEQIRDGLIEDLSGWGFGRAEQELEFGARLFDGVHSTSCRPGLVPWTVFLSTGIVHSLFLRPEGISSAHACEEKNPKVYQAVTLSELIDAGPPASLRDSQLMSHIIGCFRSRDLTARFSSDPCLPRSVPSQSRGSSRRSGFVLQVSLSGSFPAHEDRLTASPTSSLGCRGVPGPGGSALSFVVYRGRETTHERVGTSVIRSINAQFLLVSRFLRWSVLLHPRAWGKQFPNSL